MKLCNTNPSGGGVGSAPNPTPTLHRGAWSAEAGVGLVYRWCRVCALTLHRPIRDRCAGLGVFSRPGVGCVGFYNLFCKKGRVRGIKTHITSIYPILAVYWTNICV